MKTVLMLEHCFNDENILFVKLYKPSKVIYLTTSKGEHGGYYHTFKEVMQDEYPEVDLEKYLLSEISASKVKRMLRQFTDLEAVHLTSSNGLLQFYLQEVLNKFDFELYYSDIDSNAVFRLKDHHFEKVKDSLGGIDVEEYIEIAGGALIKETSKINEDKKVALLTGFIADNQRRWKRLKKILIRKNVVLHDHETPNYVTVLTKNYSKKDYLSFKALLSFLQSIDYVKVKKVNYGEYKLIFDSPEHKAFLFITGSWLEALTYNVIRQIDDVSDVQAGVTFSWQSGDTTVKNELDVLASYHGKLFCISCKDSAHFDGDTLNELNVYAEHIGGEFVSKILVITELPMKRSVIERAQEMSIDVVLYDGDLFNFRSQIVALITQS